MESRRSCRRLLRNTGLFENLCTNFSVERFKNVFRVHKVTFTYIPVAVCYARAGKIRHGTA